MFIYGAPSKLIPAGERLNPRGLALATWVYVFDEFRLAGIDAGKVFGLAEEDPLKLFESIRGIVGEYFKEIRGVRVYDVYFDPSSLEVLVEYLVRCRYGELSVKLIYARDPRVTLSKYYEHEQAK